MSPYFRQGCSPDVTGARLKDAPDATFILHQCFTGDGSANAVAIADGPRGWGELRMLGPHRYASTGATGPHSPSIVRWDIEFDHGRLATIDSDAGYLSVAGSNLFPRVRIWHWSRGGFTATADSGFTARPAPTPERAAPPLPEARCPADGTYRASFAVDYGNANAHPADGPLQLMVFPPSDHYPAVAGCRQMVLSSLPVTVRAAHTDASLIGFHYGRLTNRRWITAPAWFLVSGNEGIGAPTPLFQGDVGIDSPYQVPRSLSINVILTRFRASDRHDFGGYTSGNGVPPNGTVTFTAGRITGLSISNTRT